MRFRINHAQVALNYLKMAYTEEKTFNRDPSSRATTYLNFCAIYSQLKKHDDALHFVDAAINVLKNEAIVLKKQEESEEKVLVIPTGIKEPEMEMVD